MSGVVCPACGSRVTTDPVAMAAHVLRRCPKPSDKAVAAAVSVLEEVRRAEDARRASRPAGPRPSRTRAAERGAAVFSVAFRKGGSA